KVGTAPMDGAIETLALCALGTLFGIVAAIKATSRLDLSRAKCRSLSGHARIARAVANLVPAYHYDEASIFKVDGATETVRAARHADFHRLAEIFRERQPETLKLTKEATKHISDLQFTEAYRVPFQFGRYVRRHMPTGAFVGSSAGVMLTDLDGNQSY